MGLAEIGMGVLILLVIVGGALFYSLTHQQAALDRAKSSPPPPKRPPAKYAVVELKPGIGLALHLRDHANRAEDRSLRPFLEIGATGRPPSTTFGEALDDPRMQAALTGVYLIRADLEVFADDPLLDELQPHTIPVFFELDAAGRSTGRKIDGGAWGADTIENMSATMTKFFA